MNKATSRAGIDGSCILNAACVSGLGFTTLLPKVTHVCFNRLKAKSAVKANLSKTIVRKRCVSSHHLLGLLVS